MVREHLLNVADEQLIKKEIEELRAELEELNKRLSYPGCDFELRHLQQEVFKRYSEKSYEIVVFIQNQKNAKEKSTVRQESTFRNKTNH